jgi:CTD kinase subunit beta
MGVDICCILGPSRWYVGAAVFILTSDVTHSLLDLYNTILSVPMSDPAFISSPSPVSPKEAGNVPHPASSTSNLNTAFRIPNYWTSQTLTEVKIHLRERRPGSGAAMSWPDEGDAVADNISEGMGQNEGTVRFLWDPQPGESIVNAA